MDMIPTAPIAPVTPVQPTSVGQARGPREEGSNVAGFDQALKEEMAALEPEGGKEPAEDLERTDIAAESAADDTLASVAQAGAEHALAQPVPILQSVDSTPPGATLPVPDVPAVAAALLGSASVLTPTSAGQGSEEEPAPMQGTARVPGERKESKEIKSNGFERNPAEQRGLGAASEQAQTLGLDAGSNPGARKLSADDAAMTRAQTVSNAETPTHFAALGGEHAVVAENHATVHSSTSLENLSAASLLTKWSAPQATSSDASPAVTSARIDTPLGAPGWAEGFQQKIIWLVDRQQQSAELHVNPPHLGPVEIMLNIGDDGAHIALCSPHAAVRAAIEASLPELRAALDERGLTLGEATVGADSGAAREQFAEARRRDSAAEGGTPATLVTESVTLQVARRGLVDIFA